MGLLELGKSDTEAIMDAFKNRVEEIAQALSSDDEKASVENKVAELVTSIKSTMSDQGPTNATFNEQMTELRKDFLPKVVEKWQDLTENSKKSLEEMGNFYCKLHLLVNLGEEANKALKLFEHAATEGRNSLAFLSSNESGSCRLTRTACEAFHPREVRLLEFQSTLMYISLRMAWKANLLSLLEIASTLFFTTPLLFFTIEATFRIFF